MRPPAAVKEKLETTPTARNGVRTTLRHRARDQSIRHMPFPIGGLLEPRPYLQQYCFQDIRLQHLLC